MTKMKVTYYKQGKLDVYRTLKSHALWNLEAKTEQLVDKLRQYSNKPIDINES